MKFLDQLIEAAKDLSVDKVAAVGLVIIAVVAVASKNNEFSEQVVTV